MDKFSYAIGMGIAQNLVSMGASQNIDVDVFAQALKDVFGKEKTQMTFVEARDLVNKYFSEMEAKMNAENIAKGKAFLEENKKREGVVTLPSGLQYEVLKEGNGKKAVFGVSQVIQGWVEALQLMNEGSKWRLYIPSELAYGDQQAGELIPPHSTLIFDVELLQIV